MIKANAIMVDKKEYEELIRLKELNHEMVTIFQAISDLSWDRFCAPTIRENCKEMIAKAEIAG